MTDDGAVLVLASNLNSFDGEVHTTIDNRIISNKNAQILLNGKEITEDTMIDNPKNISINFKGNYKGENIGYKIISAPQLTIKKVDREGTWKEIGGKLTDTIKKTYFTAYINHGENPRKDEFAYVLLPMFSKDEVNNYDTSRFEIIKLDDEAHIVKDKKTGNIRLLTAGETERIQGFPTDHTKYCLVNGETVEMPLNKRRFMMGNALVVNLIADMEETLDKIFEKE